MYPNFRTNPQKSTLCQPLKAMEIKDGAVESSQFFSQKLVLLIVNWQAYYTGKELDTFFAELHRKELEPST